LRPVLVLTLVLAASCDFGSDYSIYCAHTGRCRPARVQGSCTPVNTAGAPISVTVPDAGQQNVLVVSVMRHLVSTAFQVSDDADDTFVPAYPLEQGVVHSVQSFYAVIEKSGTRVVTAAGQGPVEMDLFVDEFQGTPEVPAVDDAQAASGIGSPAQLTLTTQSPDELVYVAAASDGQVAGFDGGPATLSSCDYNRVAAFVAPDAGALSLSVGFQSVVGGSDAGEFDVAAVSFR